MDNYEGRTPASGTAIVSLVLGIISIIAWLFNMFSFIGIIAGVGGLICASFAKRDGDTSGVRSAGFVCSIVGLVGSGIVFLACVACVGCLGVLGAESMSSAGDVFNQIFNM